jgi:hypothetical protein
MGAPGSVVLGGRRVPVERPRGRTVTGDEIELATSAAFSNDDLLSQVGMEPMLAGVATRRHARVNEPVGDDLDAQARSTSRSSVSRRRKGYRQMPTFVAALARHLQAVPPVCDAASRMSGANGRPTVQSSRLEAGRSDDLGRKS